MASEPNEDTASDRPALPGWGGHVATWVVFAIALAPLFHETLFGGALVADELPTNDVTFVGTVYEQAAAQVRDLRAPLWFPEFACGTPLAASWMYGLLYPGLALFAVLPLGAAWTWTAVLHLAWGGAGMHAYLRRRMGEHAAGFGATLFLLSEFLIGRTTCGHLNLVLPVCWAPWILRYAEGAVRGHRRAVPILAVCTGMGLLSGHAQVWAYLGPLIAIFALREAWDAPDRRPALMRVIAGGALGVGIAAVQIALTAEFLAHAAPSPPDLEQMRNVSVPPGVLAWKTLFGFDGPAPAAGALDFRHEFRGIAGIWAFGFAAVALVLRTPRRWLWAGAIVSGVVLATGLRGPLPEAAFASGPLAALRAPGRALVLVVVGVSVLAGHGFDRLSAHLEARGGTARRLPPWISLGLGVLAWAFAMPAVGSVSDATHRMDVASRLPADVRAHRVHAPGFAWVTNVEAQGIRTMNSPCYVQTEGFGPLVAEPSPQVAWWFDIGAQAAPRWTSQELVPPPESLAAIDVERLEAMGRAALFGRARADLDDAGVLAALRRGDRELHLTGPGAAEAAAAGGVPFAPGVGQVHLVAETPGLTELRVETPRDAFLLVSQKLYPGWEAEVDGAPAPLLRGNLAFPVVRVPAGARTVRLVHRPAAFRIGAAISLLCLAGALVGLFRPSRYPRPDALPRSGPPPR